MKHARPDYDHIQDPTGKIPADEPVMMFRGQDIFAPVALEAYIAMCEAMASTLPLNSPQRQSLRDMATTVRVHISLMHKWQRDHKAKMPDL
jgi:hypothetical protein